MLIPRSEYQCIANSRIRKRIIVLPVHYGRLGERKRPPQEGRLYRLRPASRYAEWCRRAAEQPTRARAVLYVLERLESEPRPILVTVRAVTREGETYLVEVLKGDHREAVAQDRPVFLARSAGYTTAASLAVRDAGEVLLDSKGAERARIIAQTQLATPQIAAVRRVAGETETLRQAMKNMRARNLVRSAERNLAAAERVLRAEVLQSELVASELGQRCEAADLPHAPGVVCA